MAPYYLDYGRSILHLSLVIRWVYQAGRKNVEDTGESITVAWQAASL